MSETSKHASTAEQIDAFVAQQMPLIRIEQERITSFADQYAGKIAIVKLGGDILRNDKLLAPVVNQIAFLSQTGMKVSIVISAEKLIDTQFSEKGLPIIKDERNGARQLSEESLTTIVEPCFRTNADKVARLLKKTNNQLTTNIVTGYQDRLIYASTYLSGFGACGCMPFASVEFRTRLLDQEPNTIPIILPICMNQRLKQRKAQSFDFTVHEHLLVNPDHLAFAIMKSLKADHLFVFSEKTFHFAKEKKDYFDAIVKRDVANTDHLVEYENKVGIHSGKWPSIDLAFLSSCRIEERPKVRPSYYRYVTGLNANGPF